MVTARPFTPAFRLSPRPSAEFVAFAELVDGNPDDIETLVEVSQFTDKRVRDSARAFAMFPEADRYHGSNTGVVMAPFLLPDVSRFSSGAFGVLYGADDDMTAVREASHRQAKRLRNSVTPATQVLLTLWKFNVKAELADLRAHDASIYDPNDYRVAQALGRKLRDGGATGVLYKSVRSFENLCLGIFAPHVVDYMERREDWLLCWDGEAITDTYVARR